MHSLSEFIDAEDMLKSLHKITHPHQHEERKSNILHPPIDWSTYPPSAFTRCSKLFADDEERNEEVEEQNDENEDEEEEREQQEQQIRNKSQQLEQQKKKQQQQQPSIEQASIGCKHLITKSKKGSRLIDSTKAHSTDDMKNSNSSLESSSSESSSGVIKKHIRSRSNPQNDLYIKTLTSNKSVTCERRGSDPQNDLYIKTLTSNKSLRCERRGSGPAYVGRMHDNDLYDRYHIPIRDQSKRLSR